MRSAQYGLLPPRVAAPVTVRARRGGHSRLAFPTVNWGGTALLYGRTVRLTAKNAGFLPGQKKWCCMCGVQHEAVSYKSRQPATAQARRVAEGVEEPRARTAPRDGTQLERLKKGPLTTLRQLYTAVHNVMLYQLYTL